MDSVDRMVVLIEYCISVLCLLFVREMRGLLVTNGETGPLIDTVDVVNNNKNSNSFSPKAVERLYILHIEI
jgi:hypothetical protein